MKKEINILYTNGRKIYKIYWLKQTLSGVYHAFYIKNTRGFHFSYHKNGQCHITDHTDNSKAGIYQSIPIKKINGIYPLLGINGHKDNIMDMMYIEYDGKKLINPILIDTRLFSSKDEISIDLSLLKAENASLLDSEYFKINADSQYSVFQIANNINPWVIIHIRSIKN